MVAQHAWVNNAATMRPSDSMFFFKYTEYSRKYSQISCVLLWFSINRFSHILPGYFINIDAIIRLPRRQCSNPAERFVHGDVIKWTHSPRYWPFVRGIHRSPVNPPHKGQWRGVLMFSLICAWTSGWVKNRDIGDLRRHYAHGDGSRLGFVPSQWETELRRNDVSHWLGASHCLPVSEPWRLLVKWYVSIWGWQCSNKNRAHQTQTTNVYTFHGIYCT